MTTAPIAAVLLAAGASSRLGEPKQLLHGAHGDALLVRLAHDARTAGCDPVLVVTGAHAAAVTQLLADAPVTCVRNPEWALGMAHSIAVGVRALEPSDAPALLLMACDQPAVNATHLARLVAEFRRRGERVVSAYDAHGRTVHGIPAAWPRADWPALASLTGDRGARSLLTGEERAVALADGALDLDTAPDVARWRGEHPADASRDAPFAPGTDPPARD
jgi:CTP:molybdopterin cytidylyltransferase MocA